MCLVTIPILLASMSRQGATLDYFPSYKMRLHNYSWFINPMIEVIFPINPVYVNQALSKILSGACEIGAETMSSRSMKGTCEIGAVERVLFGGAMG